MHAVDRWVRLGRRWGLFELACVLSMQVLGGDVQSAYLLGLAGAGYALGLASSRARTEPQKTAPEFARIGAPSGAIGVFRCPRDRGRFALVGRNGRAGRGSTETARTPSRPKRSAAQMDAMDGRGGCPGLDPGRGGFPLSLLLATARLATPSGGHVARSGDGSARRDGADGGAGPCGHRVHPTDDEGCGGRSARHLCLQRRTVPAGRVDLARCDGPFLRPE